MLKMRPFIKKIKDRRQKTKDKRNKIQDTRYKKGMGVQIPGSRDLRVVRNYRTSGSNKGGGQDVAC
jgi:hypothetical protein